MKKGVVSLFACLILTFGLCTAALAKGGNGAAQSGRGSGENQAKPGFSGQVFRGVNTGPGNPGESAWKEVRSEKMLREGERESKAAEARESAGTRKVPAVKVRGKELKFDVPPVIKEGRTLIPVRAIMNGMGAEVKWDEATKTVTVTKGEITVVIALGSNIITINGVEQTMDVPAQLISNRTFVPIRFIAQALNMNVGWDEKTGTVEIGDGDGETSETNPESGDVTGDTKSGTGSTDEDGAGTGAGGSGTETTQQ